MPSCGSMRQMWSHRRRDAAVAANSAARGLALAVVDVARGGFHLAIDLAALAIDPRPATSLRRPCAIEGGLRPGDTLVRALQRLAGTIDSSLSAIEHVWGLGEASRTVVEPRLPLGKICLRDVLTSLAIVRALLSLIGQDVAPVGQALAIVGSAISPVGDAVALIREPIAIVRDLFAGMRRQPTIVRKEVLKRPACGRPSSRHCSPLLPTVHRSTSNATRCVAAQTAWR